MTIFLGNSLKYERSRVSFVMKWKNNGFECSQKKFRVIELLAVIIKIYIKNEINVKYVFLAKASYSLSHHFFGKTSEQ